MAALGKRRAATLLALIAVVVAGGFALRPLWTKPQRSVLVVGLDGADWELLDAYRAAGAMPELDRLVREGRAGVLRSLQPPLSPLVWTTMLTGTSPLVHRILDFTRFHPQTGEREPITSDERRAKAVWEMAGDAGLDVAVFGMWATHPAEPVHGLMVSDRLFAFLRAEEAPTGVVSPAEEQARALAARSAVEREVTLDALQAYLPWLTAAEYGELSALGDPYAHPATALRRILIETRLYDRLARDWIRRARPALSIVYFQGTDSIGHVFAAYAPPRQPEIAQADFERYSAVPERYFREIDAILGGYRALAEEIGARLLVVSDHGFLWREGRPTSSDGLARATAGLWHREQGISLLWGPGVEPAPARGEGRVGQVAATILALLGLPRAAGVAEPALAGLAESAELRDFGPRESLTDPRSGAPSPEALEKLRALGYLGAGEAGARPAEAGAGTRTAGSFNNEGLLLQQEGERTAARAAFERALEIDPHSASAQYNLAGILEAEGRSDRADSLLLGALADGLGDGARLVEEIAAAAFRQGDAARARRLLDGAIDLRPGDPRLLLTSGRVRIEGRDCAGALRDFDRARRLAPELAEAQALAGTALMCLGRPLEGRTAFERSLALNPNQPRLRALLERGS